MKVILVVDVKNLGKKGTVINVADGLALNSLLPNKKAIVATKENLNTLESAKNDKKAHNDTETSKIDRYLNLIPDEISIVLKVNEKGVLFESLSAEKLKNELTKLIKVPFPAQCKVTLNNSIKQKGTYQVKLSSKDAKSNKVILITIR